MINIYRMYVRGLAPATLLPSAYFAYEEGYICHLIHSKFSRKVNNALMLLTISRRVSGMPKYFALYPATTGQQGLSVITMIQKRLLNILNTLKCNHTNDSISSRVKISEAKSEEGMTSILELLQTETSDGALYQCRAGNPFGADVFSVHLTILGESNFSLGCGMFCLCFRFIQGV